MNAVIYLGQYFIYRIKAFFHHWYADGFFVFSHQYLVVLAEFDRILAWKVTLKNIFQPLYKDFSAIGYVFGFIFRSARLVLGGFIYLCIFVLAAVVFLIWILFPVYVILRIFNFSAIGGPVSGWNFPL